MEAVMRRSFFVVLATGLLVAAQMIIPASAGAASIPLTITADRAAAIPTGHLWGYNDFFPRVLSIHRGATIRFSIQGFHTATLLPAGMSPTTARLTNGILTGDAEDTTPNPNGSTHTALNLGAAFPSPGGCGSAAHPCTFSGSAVVNSGAPVAGPLPNLNVKVTAPFGFYRFLCLVHPNMQGWLAVVPGAFPVTTPAQLATAVRAQVAHDRAAGFLAEARANVAHSIRNADGTRTWYMTAGTGSPDGFVAINEMLPRRLPIHRGDKVTWVSRALNEPHTVTFPRDLHTDMAVLCEAGAVDTPATPTRIPPRGPQDFTCSGAPPDEVEFDGGNGIGHVTSPTTKSDSGFIASAAFVAAFGLPATAAKRAWTVSFSGAQRTTYRYVCQIHDGMAGVIVVH
jgi:plastocyanin